MKTRLTTEQSKHLIDLGVPEEKASDIEEYNDPVSQWTHRGAPIFKLEDFLNGEILPKEILIPNTKAYALHSNWFIGMQTWVVFYGEIECGEYLSYYSSPELLDALYQLACWYYGEFKKNRKK